MKKEDVFDITKAIEGVWDKLSGWVDSIIINLPNIILAIVLFVLFVFIAKLLGRAVNKLMLRRGTQHSIRQITVKILKLIIISIGFFIALGVLNLDKFLTSLLAAAGVGALAVGLALQGTLNNTFSGILMSFLPEVQIHDWIETNGYAGEVLEINLRSIVIIESDNNHVVIPNSKIADNTFKNFSRTPRSRIMVNCGVGYESDLEKVEQVTLDTIKAIFKTKKGEKIEFAYEEFGDSSINFVVRFWENVNRQSDILFAKHKAIMAIRKAFREHDINIPFPIRTLDFGKNKFRSETIHIASQPDSTNPE